MIAVGVLKAGAVPIMHRYATRDKTRSRTSRSQYVASAPRLPSSLASTTVVVDELRWPATATGIVRSAWSSQGDHMPGCTEHRVCTRPNCLGSVDAILHGGELSANRFALTAAVALIRPADPVRGRPRDSHQHRPDRAGAIAGNDARRDRGGQFDDSPGPDDSAVDCAARARAIWLSASWCF